MTVPDPTMNDPDLKSCINVFVDHCFLFKTDAENVRLPVLERNYDLTGGLSRSSLGGSISESSFILIHVNPLGSGSIFPHDRP